MGCSSDSQFGMCPFFEWTCDAMHVARTCSTFPPDGDCTGLSKYPHATIKEYGSINGNRKAMMHEILTRGPITCGIDADPLRDYAGGIVVNTPGVEIDHVISFAGWGMEEETQIQYWFVRNSWGENWGEMGFTRVAFGSLMVENECAWADVDHFMDSGSQKDHCSEDGSNCKGDGSACGRWCEAGECCATVGGGKGR